MRCLWTADCVRVDVLLADLRAKCVRVDVQGCFADCVECVRVDVLLAECVVCQG